MSENPFVAKLIDVADNELREYGGIDETSTTLRNRIAQYCSDLGFAKPGNIRDFAWSATFVSWCLLTAGATRQEFLFDVRHAVFVKWAIANADMQSGLFRAWPISQYKPKPGDIIHNNRSGGHVTYEEARHNDNYPSHSAIVVKIVEEGGSKFAITIGGNERDGTTNGTVGTNKVTLNSLGYVIQSSPDPYISVIEVLQEDVSIASLTTLLHNVSASFRKHGTFIYNVVDTINDYGSAEHVIAAMQRAGMQHAWIRIHGLAPYELAKKKVIKEFIENLKASGIAVAGWGWCQGVEAEAEARMALRELGYFGLSDYLADIENGHHNSKWSETEIRDFCHVIRSGLQGSFGITTFPLIDWHEPELMKAALPYVDVFAPQVYWFNFPNKKMQDQFRRPDGSKYGLNDPAEYAELCLDRWHRLMAGTQKPVVLTGQAYWNEGGMTREAAEEKLEAFLQSWKHFGQIVGLNWWHFGGGSTMSHAMFEDIVTVELDKQDYSQG